MTDEQYILIAQLLRDNPIVVYIVGIFLALVAGVYLTKAFKTIFPEKEKAPPPAAGQPAVVVLNPDDELLDRLENHIDDQAELLRAQGEFLKLVVERIRIEKQLDDTIPFRDDILAKVSQTLDDVEEKKS